MLSASSLVIVKRFPEYAVGGLFGVVLLQGFGYGLIFDMNFFLRNLSVCGGLLMVLSDSLMKRKDIFAGLPQLSESDRRHYFQLAGRVLLIFLFLGFVFNGKFTLLRAVASLLGLGACIMVAIGFRARESAIFLVLLLSLFNVVVNNWWSVHASHPQRDFLKCVRRGHALAEAVLAERVRPGTTSTRRSRSSAASSCWPTWAPVRRVGSTIRGRLKLTPLNRHVVNGRQEEALSCPLRRHMCLSPLGGTALQRRADATLAWRRENGA
jgi:uncharacterized membrane protein YphA (DoxX/SURF4 family)